MVVARVPLGLATVLEVSVVFAVTGTGRPDERALNRAITSALRRKTVRPGIGRERCRTAFCGLAVRSAGPAECDETALAGNPAKAENARPARPAVTASRLRRRAADRGFG